MIGHQYRTLKAVLDRFKWMLQFKNKIVSHYSRVHVNFTFKRNFNTSSLQVSKVLNALGKKSIRSRRYPFRR